jgi:hypothetical protein
METVTFFGTRFLAGFPYPPRPDNENKRLMETWMTPAEFMQWVRQTREAMRRELAADFSLRNSSQHRKDWEVLDAMERCCLWHYYGVRDA